MANADDCCDLSLESVIGFSGSVAGGLKYTPCGKYVLYPLGGSVLLRNISSGGQAFFDADNDDNVSCLAVSRDGRYLAMGQESKVATKVDVTIWDLERAMRNCNDGNPSTDGCMLHRLHQHVGRVQAVDFSCDTSFLLTLGGRDDNDLVVWDVATGRAICGSPAATDSAHCARWQNKRNDRFVTCGTDHLRVWQLCTSTPKLHPVDASMGSMRRVLQCLSISRDDTLAYVGSKTGEVIKFTIDRDEVKPYNDPESTLPSLQNYNRKRFSKGVKSVACIINPATGNTNILAGAGDGTVQILNPKLERIESHRAQLSGAVTSLSLSPDSTQFYAGTDMSQRYQIDVATFTPELRGTCHFGEIHDVKFPRGLSELFVTASVQDIRVWNARKHQELLRIRVPNLTCFAIDLTPSGTTILSAWSDGRIRAFYPETGKLKFIIPDAHTDGVTALCTCKEDDGSSGGGGSGNWSFVSGGADGRVRVWKVSASHQTMLHSMKEHRGGIKSVACNGDGSLAMSSSSDGSCIVWDLGRGIRLHALVEPTMFGHALFHPDESQYLTCGAHKKITYWDAYDASAIREIKGGEAQMTCLDLHPSGEFFLSGSADKLVRLWHYDDGVTIGLGKGHSGKVNKVTFSPDNRKIVSVGSEGGIFIWNIPETSKG